MCFFCLFVFFNMKGVIAVATLNPGCTLFRILNETPAGWKAVGNILEENPWEKLTENGWKTTRYHTMPPSDYTSRIMGMPIKWEVTIRVYSKKVAGPNYAKDLYEKLDMKSIEAKGLIPAQ